MSKREDQSVSRKSLIDRIGRSISYGLFAVGGITSLFQTSPVIAPVTNNAVSIAWAGLLTLGGILCVISVVFHEWILEYAGLPLVSSAFLVYGICSFLAFTADLDVFWASGCFGLAVCVFTFSRWSIIKNEIYDADEYR